MFTGPVLVVGAARSGTKLLRDLLNRHPDIAIPEVESEFVPRLVRLFGEAIDLSATRDRARFVREVRSSAFGLRCVARDIPLVTEADLEGVDPRDWSAILEATLRKSAPGGDTARVWGDKSPGYTKRVRLLGRVLPQARFVHIVRDPRSVVQSVKRAWKKDPIRNAAHWAEAVDSASAPELVSRTCTVRFEALVTDPEPVMRAIAAHLDLPFHPATTELAKPAERGGTTDLDASVVNKWRDGLSDDEVRRVEEIAWHAMRRVGYAPVLAAGPVPLPRWERAGRRALDAVAMTRFRIREHGLVAGLRLQLAAGRSR